MAEIEPGTPVLVKSAFGEDLERIATTGVVEGASFAVVWVSRPDEWADAQAEGREPEATPWPAEDVRPRERVSA